MGMVALLSANFQQLVGTVFSVSLKSDRVSIIASLSFLADLFFQELVDYK